MAKPKRRKKKSSQEIKAKLKRKKNKKEESVDKPIKKEEDHFRCYKCKTEFPESEMRRDETTKMIYCKPDFQKLFDQKAHTSPEVFKAWARENYSDEELLQFSHMYDKYESVETS